LKEFLKQFSDDTQVCVKTWSSDIKEEIEVIEKDVCVVLKGN